LAISQTRVATTFFFQPAEPLFPTEERIVSALRNGSSNADGGVHELCVALRALVDQVKLSFVLALQQHGELAEPIFSGDDISRLPEKVRKGWARLERNGVRLTVSHFRKKEWFTGRYLPTVAKTAARHLGVVDVLEQRACFSAMPILVDGRDVTNILRHKEFGTGCYYQPLATGSKQGEQMDWTGYAALAPVHQFYRPSQTREQSRPWCLLQTFHYLTLREYNQAMHSFQSWFRLPFYKVLKHRILWLRYGVVVGETQFNCSCAGTTASLILCGDHLRTDLTGLSVFLEPKDVDQARRMRDAVRYGLSELEEKLDYLSRTVAVESDGTFGHLDSEDSSTPLSAGSSVWSNDLRKFLPQAGGFIQALRRGWEELRAYPKRGTYLDDWKRFIGNELKALHRDLEKPDGLAESEYR
jgi:hypothetical protein